MVINLSDRPINILLRWRHIPSLRNSPARFFRFRDVTKGVGWEGCSSIGVGVSDLAVHGNFVLIVSEGKKLDCVMNEDFPQFPYALIV